MEILFILPPTLQFNDFVSPPDNVGTIEKNGRRFGMVLTDLPLGIVSLSAYLKKHIDVTVRCVDFNIKLNSIKDFEFNSFKEFFLTELRGWRDAQKVKPEYIGISALFTSSHQSVIDIAEIAKILWADSKCIVGGNYPTAAYGALLSASQHIDAICYGEGEKPLLELLQAPDFEDFVRTSPQWVNRDKLKNPLRKLEHNFIVDLDEIPPYDYDCVDIEGYRLNPNSSRYAVKERYKLASKNNLTEAGEETIGKVEAIGSISYSMPIMTSRGCPFKCTFCASHVAHGRDMRYHSLTRVISDAQRLIERYGIDGVVIQDDHFMAGKQRPYEIVDSLGKLGLGMYFQNALAIYALDLPFLQLLKQSGVDSLVLPLESGSSRVLKELMKKPLRLNIVPRVLADCREAGIFTDVNIIIGMPGETHEDIEESRNFLRTINADWFRIFTAMPIEGSEMFERCNAEGLFEDDALNANYKRPVINTGQLSPNDILEYTYSLNLELNFVYNSNMRLGNHSVAIESFKNVISVKPDHAFANYFLAQCYFELGLFNLAIEASTRYKEVIAVDQFWRNYAARFGLSDPLVSHDSSFLNQIEG